VFVSHFAPVIFGGPVTREFLRGRERHALRKVRDGFPLRQPGGGDAPALGQGGGAEKESAQ